MAKYDIAKFEELVEQGYLRKSEDDELVLYGYTDKCTYERNWNEYTRVARGLILEKGTGVVVAKPFPKFFNLGEQPETFLSNLPNLPYTATEKVDGSLGIIFNYKGKWRVATRGSLFSDQAKRAQEMLPKYNLPTLSTDYPLTILVEIIYPENRIIIDYKGKEELVLLGAFLTEYELEVERADLLKMGSVTGMPVAAEYDDSIEDLITKQKTLPIQEEGFVVCYYNGLRVKIKGDEYMRVAKIMAHMSPISLWECMHEGVVDTTYLMQLPEELRKSFEPIVQALEDAYNTVSEEIGIDISNLPTTLTTTEARKEVGLFLASASGKTAIRHPGAMFSVLLERPDHVETYIMKKIRPDSNILKST